MRDVTGGLNDSQRSGVPYSSSLVAFSLYPLLYLPSLPSFFTLALTHLRTIQSLSTFFYPSLTLPIHYSTIIYFSIYIAATRSSTHHSTCTFSLVIPPSIPVPYSTTITTTSAITVTIHPACLHPCCTLLQ